MSAAFEAVAAYAVSYVSTIFPAMYYVLGLFIALLIFGMAVNFVRRIGG